MILYFFQTIVSECKIGPVVGGKQGRQKQTRQTAGRTDRQMPYDLVCRTEIDRQTWLYLEGKGRGIIEIKQHTNTYTNTHTCIHTYALLAGKDASHLRKRRKGDLPASSSSSNKH